jgi:hypothetical protein
MKKTILVLLMAFVCQNHILSQTPSARTTFDSYLKKALAFSNAYPREKAYLHFDNTSYFVGDTIWYKAYLTLAGKDIQPSPISRPLYVELVDQVGHVVEKQIVKMINGEGMGQFILSSGMLSGYYEVRAYTRWMLGFTEPQYFSRTFPIYKSASKWNQERSIETYDLDPSMRQRPQQKAALALRFFPEGGQLVKGIRSVIAFQAESKTEGDVKISGTVTDLGQEVAKFQTIHDGIGTFEYTPSEKTAEAKVTYKGKNYTFNLPDALPSGYVMNIQNEPGAIVVNVSCNSETPQDSLAVFVSHDGVPSVYRILLCSPSFPQTFLIRNKDMQGGVNQVSLINRKGETLCNRFCFVMPKSSLDIQVSGLKQVYQPYSPIQCDLQVTNSLGQPVQGKMSVSLRSGISSDYLEYDNNIFTDLLLTSDLKGYIHQPGYYFEDMSVEKLKELDNEMLVHGWRKYDMSQLIGTKSFKPSQTPETNLIVHGQIKSPLFKKELKNILVSVFAKTDSTMVAGKTVTDDEGHFDIPLEDFENSLDAVIQTQRNGKNNKKLTSIMLDRNFSPDVAQYDYYNLHPVYKDTKKWISDANAVDSLYTDSLKKSNDVHLLDNLIVTSKRHRSSVYGTNVYERNLDAYFDIRQELDKLRDEGKDYQTLPDLMEKLSPYFFYERTKDSVSEDLEQGEAKIFNMCTYKQRKICYVMDNRILSNIEVGMMSTEVDGIKSIIVCMGNNGLSNDIINNSMKNDSIDINKLDKYAIFFIIPAANRHHLLDTNEGLAYGTRQTMIQGYNQPMEFYSPVYEGELPVGISDYRRTLYWNPSLSTDEHGRATIKCYNGMSSTPVVVDAQMMGNNTVGGTTVASLP